MLDTTQPQDLAEKIEWVGFRNLSRSEKKCVGIQLHAVSRCLPRVLAHALWRFYGRKPPVDLETRPMEDSLQSYLRRDAGRKRIDALMNDTLLEEE